MQDQEEHALQPVDLSLAVVKPLGARWMMKLYDYMKQQPQVIKNGFVKAGITLIYIHDQLVYYIDKWVASFIVTL